MGFNKKTESQNTLDLSVNDEKPEKDLEKEQEEEYDPYKQEQTGKTTSYFEALLILIKASLGTGILGMPRAFYNAGYLLGTIGTIVAGVLTTQTAHMISSTEYELSRRKRVPRLTYPETIEAAFELGPGNFGRFKRLAGQICYVYMILLEFGGDCVYAIFIAENVKAICDHRYGTHSLRWYQTWLMIPLILICWIKNLKYLAPGSTLGTGCAVGCFGVIYYFIFSQPIALEGRKAIGSFREFALFFGTALFAMGAFGIVVPLKNKMTNPKRFGGTFGVVNATMIPNMTMYVLMGFFGYLAYGNFTQSSITLNLPQTGAIGDVIRILMAGSIFTTYPLCNYVVTDMVWHKWMKLKFGDNKHLDKWEYVFRTCLCFTNYLCCIAIPNLELFMSLSGSLCLPALGIFFPIIIHTLTFWHSYTGWRFFFFLFRAALIVALGLFAFLVSFSTTVYEIVTSIFLAEDNHV
nr:PREDICTED: proton-coupled amino acid transporter-like protein CG1139 [Bemisia tabaci]XP_018898185.1 PREDICTED: proton-coupled amino acid transporter-like protein CG1139 [Bemisia tabaci]XP_018898186.1 PREDICTED: proton-coupled amino acid transporter-like protein CG1139 [Bemisia tabaci]